MKHVDAFLVGWIWLQVVGGGCRGFFTGPARLAAEVLLLVKCRSRLFYLPLFVILFLRLRSCCWANGSPYLYLPLQGQLGQEDGGGLNANPGFRSVCFFIVREWFFIVRGLFLIFRGWFFYCPRIVLPSLSLFSPGLPSTMLVAQWSQPWLPESSRIHNWETSRSTWAGQLQ